MPTKWQTRTMHMGQTARQIIWAVLRNYDQFNAYHMSRSHNLTLHACQHVSGHWNKIEYAFSWHFKRIWGQQTCWTRTMCIFKSAWQIIWAVVCTCGQFNAFHMFRSNNLTLRSCQHVCDHWNEIEYAFYWHFKSIWFPKNVRHVPCAWTKPPGR